MIALSEINEDVYEIEELFFKGTEVNGVKILYTDELENKVRDLYDYKDTLIEDLPAKQKAIIIEVMNLVDTLKEDVDEYRKFYNLAQRVFAGVKNIQPKTVAAYFLGCSLNKEGVQTCSILCTGSMPKPESESTCNHNILWIIYNNESFNFLEINMLEDSTEETIIYTDFQDYESFPGFSAEEKRKLKNQYGVKNLRLVSRDNENEYLDLLGSIVNLSDVKNRTTLTRASSFSKITDMEDRNTDSTSYNYTALWVALGVLVLALVIFVMFYFMFYRSG
jgi:hypothetical protein